MMEANSVMPELSRWRC